MTRSCHYWQILGAMPPSQKVGGQLLPLLPFSSPSVIIMSSKIPAKSYINYGVGVTVYIPLTAHHNK